ncbi:LysR family transcriptional regulator [Novosphingobium sediminicola]|uniref:DNA-binding transcriptional LysR family regulator n=1 Tax=Novosphingobium sediminicola TaxID=563162 RepID=A0A7W6CJX1_9SPHN|nr:LysR family transcriptional regulator [Novosphingobium sediminicola]MBB3954351.1 DNA-binding transcriptional LysR family regulator [Novosphingobium sediminicola]
MKSTKNYDFEALDAISFRQLRLFESIGRLQSVRRASEDCNLSQPAVTQSLSKLEVLVGARLVERRASGSYLNKEGDAFYARVSRFLTQFEEALSVFNVEGGRNGARSAAARLLRSQVRVLIAIVEAGNIGPAAEQLGLSPATLQRAARDLESNLRKPLFYRTAAGTVPTVEAIELGRRFKLALQEIEWGIRELNAAQGEAITPITVGAMPLGGNVLLGSVLEAYLAREPRAQVLVRNESAVEMIKSLRAGDVDMVVGLIPADTPDDLAHEALTRTPHAIVARKDHPLAAREKVTLDDLAGYEWLVGAPGSSRRTCFANLFEGRTEARAPVATSALSIIKHLLKGSDRLTLMTSFEIQHEGEGLVALPFGPIAPVPAFGITTRAGWLPTRAHAMFMQIIRDQMAVSSVNARLNAAAALEMESI